MSSASGILARPIEPGRITLDLNTRPGRASNPMTGSSLVVQGLCVVWLVLLVRGALAFYAQRGMTPISQILLRRLDSGQAAQNSGDDAA
ncbi:MAG: hypothetical protein H0X28_04315 [Solirubrobacterales bacterium]|nr:hypothetical protein [Solirubrobacterales bacterium]